MEVTEPKRRGRPPAMSHEERRRAIVDAAENIFTSKGYAAASMDDVVRACGMSKKTVYETFDSKEQLFREIVVSSLDGKLDLHIANTGETGGTSILRDLLRAFAEYILSPRQIALMRLVFTESPAAPEIATIFFEAAVFRGQAMLAETIRRASGPMTIRQSEELSNLMCGALLGPEFFSALLRRTDIPEQKEIHERIDWLLDILGPTLAFKG